MSDLTPDLNRASRAYPFPGGIAGKLGDRFEAKWAVKKLFEVILGHADALKFEFVDPDNHGVEFWLSKNGHKEWYQAKRQNTLGNWTIRRLEDEGVLATARAKLSTTPDDKFFFLSTIPATQLAHLAQRATLTENGSDAFLSALTDADRADHLPALNRSWNASNEQTWHYLRRLEILCEPETDLDINLRMVGGQLFRDNYETFFPLLREYLENNFSRELTTEIVHREIIEGKILYPRAPLDPTLRERIVSANQNYLNSYTPFGAGGSTIPRQEAQETLALLEAEDGPSVILLTGNAGTGKSGVVRQILSCLDECDSTYLAFRVDNRLGIDSAAALGQALYERRENPVFTLQSLASDGTAILCIDQIDAISEISGRTGAIREVVLEFIRFAKFSRNIRIIAACRTYDLSNDSALRELEKDVRVKRIEVKPLDWVTEIEPLLRDKGVPVERITPKQRELLSLPLNLALFLETSSSDEQTFQFKSTSDLFDRLIEKKQHAIRACNYPTFALMPALSTLAAYMSRDQSLDAPASVLDSLPNALDLLATEHLIVHQNGRINFFHESLFDYAFARSFVAERKHLLDFLKDDEQHLFRRTQVRQILAMYRQTGPQRHYLTQLHELLASPDVRYHLKDAVARWLGGVDAPTEAELDIALALDRSSQCMPALVRQAVYPQIGWLPILLRRGFIVDWLNSESSERREDVLSILRNAVKTYPVVITSTLRSWWQNDPAHGVAILRWFSWLSDIPPCRDLLELNLDLIRSKPEGLFDRAGLYDRHSLSSWLKYDPDAAGELLRVWFETWFEVFPEGHPFGHDHHNDFDFHWIEELQKKSPEIFLRATIPAFAEAIRRINLSNNGQYWSDYTWQIRYDRDSYGSGRFLSLIKKSLAILASDSPLLAKEYLNKIDYLSHPAALFLWLETIGFAGQSLGYLLPSLLSADQLFDAGPSGADWLSFAHAANAALPYLSLQDKIAVESRILKHWPELNRAKKLTFELANGRPEEEPFWTRKSVIRNLQWSGNEQWCCLNAIDVEALSPTARQRLAQLDRKFLGQKPAKPSHSEARLVPPPIGSDRSAHMSDSAWLNAITTYREDRETSRSKGDWLGHTGSHGLAGILRGRAKEKPERFAKLLCQLPIDTPSVYFNEILNGLIEGDPCENTLKATIRYAHSLPEHPCCEGICRILQKHPTLVEEDDIFETLLWYVENGPAATDDESDQRRTQELILTADQLTQQGGFTQARSGYYDRGIAIEALASVLWDCAPQLEEGVRVLQKCIQQESLESVRCFLAEPIYSVLHHDNCRAAELLKQLVMRPQGADLFPLSTYTGTRILFYILHGDSGIGHELLDLLLSAENEDQRLLGGFHLFREAFYDEALATRADTLVKQSDQYRKLAADAAANHLPIAAYQTRAEQQLAEYFNDPIKEIRTTAAGCFRGIREGESIEPYRALMRTFIQSQAFNGDNFQFFYLLKETTESTTEEVILAAERVLDLAEQPDDTSSPTLRHREMHYLDDLLLREYRATEDRPELRTRILDILDRMLILGLYGTDKIIQEHERF
ncbi:MAG: AAA family ATPase [Desulfuromonadales bacterium]|nr:AAA family ATPase [Desulfuromonadales bacterium]